MSALAVSLLVAAAGAPSIGLEEVVEMALENAEDPRIAEARRVQAEAELREAWAAVLPTVNLSGTYRRRAFDVVVGDSVLQAFDAFSSALDFRSTLFEARSIPDIQAAEGRVDAARAQAEDARLGLAHAVAQAYLAARMAEAMTGAAERRSEAARKALDAAEQRVQAGLDGRSVAQRAALEAVEADVVLTRSRGSERRARLALDRAVSQPVRGTLQPLDAAPAVPAPTELDPAERPDLRVAKANLRAAEDAALAPWLDLVPNLSVDGQFTLTNETGFLGRALNGSVAVTLAWTVYDGGVRYARARARSAERSVAALELAQLERTAAIEVQEALSDLKAARAEVELAGERASLAQAYASEVRARAAAGLATAVEAADAAVEAFEAEVSAVTVDSELSLAALRLRQALGLGPTEPLPTISAR